VQFNRVLRDTVEKFKKKQVRRKTALRLRQYQHSPRLKFSRIYGYRMVDENTAAVIPEEGEVVKLVFQRLVEGRSISEIKIEMDVKDMRTRFKNRWTKQQIRGLVRPIFAGLVERRAGGYQKSSIYPSIVSPATFQRGLKAITRMAESVHSDPLTALLGSRD
jgi:hypothetical protein